ncbi:suppressor of fused domain protein [Dactylosporangium sp. CA-139066]|uniref:suppressor of fused domain protein n=1 Tax=Dactylosporangium sp. CA-139066 TaxID=3239930 RepID=UPI003D8A229C
MTEGSGYLYHQSQHDGFVAAEPLRDEVAAAIDRHVEEFFGPVEFVWHEIASHLIQAHVYVVEPTERRPYRTLMTVGMSALPMRVPDGHEVSPFAELMIALPADWPLSDASIRDERYGWPVRVLKEVARLPFQYGTWIGEWHSVPNGDPAEPYAQGVPFAGVVVTPMLRVPAEARTIDAGGGTTIDLLALVPLHPAEVALKVQRGTDALIEVMDRGRVTELLDPARPSLV